MNYLEILEWVQDNLVSIRESGVGVYTITYLNYRGVEERVAGKSLVEVVLKINELDLV